MKLDTLTYAKKLVAAGCALQLAEAHASAQQDVLVEISDHYLAQFVTKQDIKDINAKFDLFEQKITNLVLKMTITLGGLVAAGVIILAAIIKL